MAGVGVEKGAALKSALIFQDFVDKTLRPDTCNPLGDQETGLIRHWLASAGILTLHFQSFRTMRNICCLTPPHLRYFLHTQAG